MDKHRLYYQTPYVKSFMCTVESCVESQKGTWLAVLNQTGFYPEGGGQPCDTGSLNGTEVLSVREKDGKILHELSESLEPGTIAEGIIDWQRRYDNMQQHTGEHILSGLAHRLFEYDNVGFHMGAEAVTVDFNGVLSPAQLEELENEANQILYDNRPVEVLYPGAGELKAMEYRSKKELKGQVRIVHIPGADTCACCGTHVENTGEVGIIKIRDMIHYKGGVRISMLCGRRALLDYRARLQDEMKLSVLLSAKLELVPGAVEKLKNDSQNKDALNGRLYERLFDAQVKQYPESSQPLLLFEEDLTPVQARKLATLLYEQQKASVAVVCSGGDEKEEYLYAMGSSLADMRSLSKSLNAVLNGRGGGSGLMAQGTFRAKRKDIEAAIFERLQSQ